MKSNKPADHLKVAPFPMKEYTSQELVDGLIRRDKQVSTAFFVQYSGQVNRLVKKLLGPDQEHVDVVNNVFVQILKSIESLRDAQALTRWVSTVSIQTVQREIKSRVSRRRFVVYTDAPEEPVGAGNDRKGKLSRHIYRALRKFPTDEYVHFVLYYIEGHNFEEVAKLTNCSVSTAKRRSKNCKKRFLTMTTIDSELQDAIKEWKND